MRRLGGAGLITLGVFMLFGLLRADVELSAPSTLAAVALTIVLPIGAGVALLFLDPARRRRTERRAALRSQTIEAAVIQLATQHAGRLTVVEVVSELALTPEDAKRALDNLMLRDLADIEVTPGGVLVYRFGDVQKLDEKSRARGLLE